MDSLARINREFGLTVIVNLHTLDLARAYCGRLIGMAGGRVVFDGPPAALTDTAANALYGMAEPGAALDAAPVPLAKHQAAAFAHP